MEAHSVHGAASEATPQVENPRRYRVYLRHPSHADWWYARHGIWGADFEEAMWFETYIEGLNFCRSVGLDAQITGVFSNGSPHLNVDSSVLQKLVRPRQCG